MTVAERARLWINCATHEETQHRAKIRLERLRFNAMQMQL